MRFEKWSADRFPTTPPKNPSQQRQQQRASSNDGQNNNKNNNRSNAQICRDLLSYPPSKMSCVDIPRIVDQLESAQSSRSQSWFKLLETKKSLVLQAAELQKLLSSSSSSTSSSSPRNSPNSTSTNTTKLRQTCIDEIRRLRTDCQVLHNEVHSQDEKIKKLRNELELITSDAVNLTETEKDTNLSGGENTKNLQRQKSATMTFLTENDQSHHQFSASVASGLPTSPLLPLGRRSSLLSSYTAFGSPGENNDSSNNNKLFHQTMSQVIKQASNHDKKFGSNNTNQNQQLRRQLIVRSAEEEENMKQKLKLKNQKDSDDEDNDDAWEDSGEYNSEGKMMRRRKSKFNFGSVAALTAARIARRKELGLDAMDDDSLLLAASQQKMQQAAGDGTTTSNGAVGAVMRQRSMNALERHKSIHNIQQQQSGASQSSGGIFNSMSKIPLQDFLFMCIKGAAKLQVRPDAIRAAELIIKVQAKFRQRRIQKKFYMLRRLRKLFDRDAVSRCFYAWRNETQATQSANRFALRRSFRGWNSVVSESIMRKQSFGFIWRGLRDYATIERVFKCWWRFVRYLNTKADSTTGVRRIAFTEGKNNHIDAWDEFLRREDERRRLYKARSGAMSFLSFKKKRSDVDEETENWLCKKKHWDTWQEFVDDARKVVQQELMAEDFIKRRTLRKHFSAWEQLSAFTHQIHRREFATKVFHWTRWKKFVMQEKLEREGVRDFKRVHKLLHLTKWRRKALEARRKTAAHAVVLQNNRKISLMAAYAWKGMTTHLSYLECWKEWLDYTQRRRTWKAFVSSRVAVHNHFLKGAIFAAWVLETPSLSAKFVMSKQHRDTNINLIAGDERLSDFSEELKSLQFRVRATNLMRRVSSIEDNARSQLAHFSSSITKFRNDEMRQNRNNNSKNNNNSLLGASGSVAEQIIASARSGTSSSNTNPTLAITGATPNSSMNNEQQQQHHQQDEENHNAIAPIPTAHSKDSIALLSKRQQRRMENVMQTCIATARSGTAFMNPFEHHAEMWSPAEINTEKSHIEENFEWWLHESGVDRSLSFAVMHLLVDYVYREWILPRKRRLADAHRMLRQKQQQLENAPSSSAAASPVVASPASSILNNTLANIAAGSAGSNITVGERRQLIAQHQQNVARRMTFAIGVVSSVGMPFIQLGPNQKGAYMSIGNLEKFITSQSRTIQTRRIKEERNQGRRLRKFLQKQAALKLFQVSYSFSMSSLYSNVVTPYRMVLDSAKVVGKKRVVPLPKVISKGKQEIFALRRRILPHPENEEDEEDLPVDQRKYPEANTLIGARGTVHCDYHKFVELQVARGCALRDLAYLGVNTTMYGFTNLKQENMQKREYQLGTIAPLETELTLSTDRIKKRIHDVAPRPIVNPISVDFKLLEVVGFNPKVFNLRSLLRLRERMRLQEEEKQEVYAKAEAAIAARANKESVDDIFDSSKRQFLGDKTSSFVRDPMAGSHLQQLTLTSAQSFSAFSLKSATVSGSFLGSRHRGANENIRDFKKFMANHRRPKNTNNDDDDDDDVAGDDFYSPVVASPMMIFGADGQSDPRSPQARMNASRSRLPANNNKRSAFLTRRRSYNRKKSFTINPETGEIVRNIEGIDVLPKSQGGDGGEDFDDDDEEGEEMTEEEMARRMAEEEFANRPAWMRIEAENDQTVVFDDYQRMAPKTWRVGVLSLQKRNQIRKDEFVADDEDGFFHDDGNDDDNDFYASAASAKTAIENLDFVDRWIEDPSEDEIEEIIARRAAGLPDSAGHLPEGSDDFFSEDGKHLHHHPHHHHNIKKGQTVLRDAKITAPYFKKVRERIVFDEQNVFVPPMPPAFHQRLLQQQQKAGSASVSARADAMPVFDDSAFTEFNKLLKEKAQAEEIKKIIQFIKDGETKLLREHKKMTEDTAKDETVLRGRMEREERHQRGISCTRTTERVKLDFAQLMNEKEPSRRSKIEMTEEGERDRVLNIEEEFRRERVRLEMEEQEKEAEEEEQRRKQQQEEEEQERLRQISLLRPDSAISRRTGTSSSRISSSRKSTRTTTVIDENGNEIEIEIEVEEEHDEEDEEQQDDDHHLYRRPSSAASSKATSRVSYQSKHQPEFIFIDGKRVPVDPGYTPSELTALTTARTNITNNNNLTTQRGGGGSSRPSSGMSVLAGRIDGGSGTGRRRGGEGDVDEEEAEEFYYEEEEEEEYYEEEEVEVVDEDGSITTTTRSVATRSSSRRKRHPSSQQLTARSSQNQQKISARSRTISTVSDNETARQRRKAIEEDEAEEEEKRNKEKLRKRTISFVHSPASGEDNDDNNNKNIAAKILRHASNVRGAFSSDQNSLLSGDFMIGDGIGGGDSSDDDAQNNDEEEQFTDEEIEEELVDETTGEKKTVKRVIKKRKSKKASKKKIHRISYTNAAKALEQFQKEMRELLPQRVIAARPIVVFDDDDYTTDEDQDDFDEDDMRDVSVSARERKKKRKLRVLTSDEAKEKKRKYKPHIIAKELVQQPDPRLFVERSQNDATAMNSGRQKRTNALLEIQKDRMRMMRGAHSKDLSIASPYDVISSRNNSLVRKLSRREEDELYSVFEVNPETGLLEPREPRNSHTPTSVSPSSLVPSSSSPSHHEQHQQDDQKTPTKINERHSALVTSLSPVRNRQQQHQHSSASIVGSSPTKDKRLVRATQIALELEGRRTVYASYETGTLIHDISEDIHRFFEADKAKRKEMKRQAKADQEQRRAARRRQQDDQVQEEKKTPRAALLDYQKHDNRSARLDEEVDEFFKEDSDDDDTKLQQTNSSYHHVGDIPKLMAEHTVPYFTDSSSMNQKQPSSNRTFSSSTATTTTTIEDQQHQHHQPTSSRPQSAPPISSARTNTTSSRGVGGVIQQQQQSTANINNSSLPPRPPSAPSPPSAHRQKGAANNNQLLNESFLTTPDLVRKEQSSSPASATPPSSARSPRDGLTITAQNNRLFGNNIVGLSERDVSVIRTLERRNFRRKMGQPFLTSLTKSILSPPKAVSSNNNNSAGVGVGDTQYSSSLLGDRRLHERNMFSLYDNRGISIDVPQMYVGEDEDHDQLQQGEEERFEETEEEYEEEVSCSDDNDEEEKENERKTNDDDDEEEDQQKQKKKKKMLVTRKRTIRKPVAQKKTEDKPDKDAQLLGIKKTDNEDPQRAKVRENLEKMMSTASLINRHLASMK